MPIKIPERIQDDHGSEWHWRMFADFCKLKADVNEPSPHMQMLGLLTPGFEPAERVWFTGLYAATYNIPSAMVMYQELPWSAVSADPTVIYSWLQTNWSGITTRTERRTVRSPQKINECLLSYIKWAKEDFPQYLALANTPENYDFVWQDTDAKLRYMGRYIIIRLLEGLHRFSGLQPILYDIRSIGGWSPKRALGLLFPQHLGVLLSPDTKENILFVDGLAYKAMDRFADEFHVPMTPYVFAAMLCEYRVAYEKRHQYPGWTIDQEPAYMEKISPYWLEHRGELWVNGIWEQFTDVRKALFSEHCLGELNGWSGTRVEPRYTLRDYEYNWSDRLYVYAETTDFSIPVVR